MCLCIPHASSYRLSPEEGVCSPGTRVTDQCETRYRYQELSLLLCKSSKCSSFLSYLSSPWTQIICHWWFWTNGLSVSTPVIGLQVPITVPGCAVLWIKHRTQDFVHDRQALYQLSYYAKTISSRFPAGHSISCLHPLVLIPFHIADIDLSSVCQPI